jgi:transcriptional regulator with XRE-family HTH domain
MRIKEIIKEKGFTVKQVADLLGMTSPSLSDAINGNPTVSKLERIAEVIGCDVSDFFEKKEIGIFICPNCKTKISIEVKK